MNIEDLTVRDIALLTRLPATTSLRVLARALGMEPSNLSRSIKSLEEQLGVELLKRSSVGVTATAEARLIAKKAVAICDAVRDLPIVSSASIQPYERFLNLGSRGFVNTYVAPALCAAFQRDAAETCGLRFLDLSPDESMHAAKGAVIDALVGFEDASLGRNWVSSEVGTLSWKLYAAARHPSLSSASRLDVALLRVGHHCSFDGKGLVTSDGLLFDSLGVRQVGHGAQSAYTALAIAAATDQLACVPAIVAKAMLDGGQIAEVEVEGLSISTPVYLSVHSERVHARELKLMQNTLTAALRAAV